MSNSNENKAWKNIKDSAEWQAFADKTVRGIFNERLDSDAKRIQTWLIIKVLMEMHPQLDVYTHAFEGLAGRTGIVFGKKRIGSNTKGRVCFMLLRQGVDLPRLELGRIIDGIHHAEPTKPHCIFSLDDTNVKIQEQIDTLFLGFKDTIGTYFTPNGARCLPLDFETGVC